MGSAPLLLLVDLEIAVMGTDLVLCCLGMGEKTGLHRLAEVEKS